MYRYYRRTDCLQKPWDLFTYNDKAIRFDFDLVTKGRSSQKISETNNIRGKAEDIFIEEGADVEFAYLNTNGGPIYIGKEAEVMEGVMLRGPIAICDHAVMKMGAKVFEQQHLVLIPKYVEK